MTAGDRQQEASGSTSGDWRAQRPSVSAEAAQAFFTWTREAQITLKPDGTIVAWNPAAERLLHRSAAVAVGQRLPDLLPGLADLLATESTAPVVERGGGLPWQRRTLTLPDGTERAVELALAVTGPDGDLALILADRSALVAAETTACATDRWYRSMLDSLPIGLTVVSLRDERYPTLYQNNRGIDVSGWANEEWERDPDFTLQILHPEDRERLLAFREEFRSGFKPFDVEYRVLRPDGEVVWLRDWGTVVYDETGHPDHNVVCLMDVTAQKSAELALREALDELSEAHAEVQAISQAKSEYLSFLSHEFRTPLTSIQGFSELIASGGVPDDEARQFAEIIGSNAQRLSRMIADLLDMDRLESGQQRVRWQVVDVGRLIRETLVALSGLTYPHTVTLTVADDLPLLQADADLLMHLVTNLVTNAMKYTPPEAPIVIEVSHLNATILELTVTDAGPGIPDEALETIFQRFTRLERDDYRRTVGTGLGLAIAREIVDLHHGRLWAENVPGGARFVVQLPVVNILEAE